MAKLVVFDLDGTLVDSAGDLTHCINLTRAEFSLAPLSVAEVAGNLGCGIRDLLKKSLPPDLTEADLDKALHFQQKFYSEHLTDTTRLYPGVAEGLQSLRADGAHLALVTNKETEAATKILTALKVAELFDIIIGGTSGYPFKPEPDALLALQQQFQTDKTDCWMVGDHHTDLGAGRRADFKRIFCSFGFGNCGGETPDFTVGNFSDIVPLIRNN